MQIGAIGREVKGFRHVAEYAIRINRMVKDEAKKRAKILTFWKRYGLKATIEAFGVSRATLFEWKKRLHDGKGRLSALNAKDKAPRKRRKRLWPIEIIRMIKVIRSEHPNLGKEKLHPELKEWCVQRGFDCPSVATIGRLIADDPAKMRRLVSRPSCAGRRVQRRDRKTKARKPKGYVPTKPGECIAFDTVERIVKGSRRYVITATDIYSRFAFAYGTKSHASKEAALVFKAIFQSFPYKVEHVLTDNGSEFMKHFQAELEKESLVHWHTYPKTPKMNAHCERFNRSIQEEFVDWNDHLLQDPIAFNKKLADYLVWFNTKRPHEAHGQRSPIQFLTQQNPEESRMRWARTVH
jgi:transposase InsO family protein